MPILRMSWSFAVELPEILKVIKSQRRTVQDLVLGIHRFDAAQVKHGIKQHGSMAIRKDEAIAIWPDRICRIEAQKLLPQNISHRSQSHRRAGVAGVGLLHGVNREGANGVYA